MTHSKRPHQRRLLPAEPANHALDQPSADDVRKFLKKIVSGGQTGVDRAALDVAIQLGLEHGGWCPRGRTAEDGRIPACYQLTECVEPDYRVRTEKNVIDSDGTLILFHEPLTGGTRLTRRFARQHAKPYLMAAFECGITLFEVRAWLIQHRIRQLNVAGPRETSCPGVGREAKDFLLGILGGCDL